MSYYKADTVRNAAVGNWLFILAALAPILNPRSVSQVVMLVAQFMGGVMAFGCSKMSIKQEAVYVTHAVLSMMVLSC